MHEFRDFLGESAYHLAKELEDRKTLESLSQVKDSPLWKMIWKLPIQNVAKIFFWRECHNLLPTKDNMLRRKVVKDPFCPICEKDPEAVLHAFWECPAAMNMWGVGKKAFQKVTYSRGGILAFSRIYDGKVRGRRFRNVHSANPTDMAETKQVAL